MAVAALGHLALVVRHVLLLGLPALLGLAQEEARADRGHALVEVELAAVPAEEADDEVAHALAVTARHHRHRSLHALHVRAEGAVELGAARVARERRVRVAR